MLSLQFIARNIKTLSKIEGIINSKICKDEKDSVVREETMKSYSNHKWKHNTLLAKQKGSGK